MTSLFTKFTGESAKDASNTSRASSVPASSSEGQESKKKASWMKRTKDSLSNRQWRPSGRFFRDRDDFGAEIGPLVKEFNAQSAAAATAMLEPVCPTETLTTAAASLRALDKAQQEHDEQQTQLTLTSGPPPSSGSQSDNSFKYSPLDMARYTARKEMDRMPAGSHVQLTNLLEAQGMEEARLNDLIQSLRGVTVVEEVEDSSSDDDSTREEASTSGV